ncbi:hypothetical protein LV780_19965 (plasmid) [Cereibacter azotoformans]|uniref:hypothetical protein n=1 Tax=Cereibacter azotoformans TaxID=43057 RepID=UPI001F3254A2|nr:hypothetical protein [Cereibacter azotoformans]UIJ33106.1 hypothetical protein LV780_19965 [Cereibacter azotoformans]
MEEVDAVRIDAEAMGDIRGGITAKHPPLNGGARSAGVTAPLDGAQVARFTPADVPGALWEMEAKMQILCSVEHHAAWAGWTAADHAGGAGAGTLSGPGPLLREAGGWTWPNARGR